METTVAFTFGVLSVLAVILIAVIAVGIVKVIKQGKEIKELQQYNDDISREVHLRYDEVRSYVDSRIDKIQNKTQLIKG